MLMSIVLVMPSNHLILCNLLLLLPSIFTNIRVFSISQLFSSSGQSIVLSASTSVFPVTFRTDILQNGLGGSPCSSRDTQESSPQFKSINSSVLSFLYGPNLTSIYDYWKNIALTRQPFVGKIISLLFNMLSRLLIAFLPRSNHLLISWLQSPSAVILEVNKRSLSLFPLFPHLFAMK